uniref:Uncharacterized protein n=1 Tax=Candidatus Kentrum sp. LPFa TaxID=2126335 RepID=A0A450WQH7_9GAMM|nr:MAG: hypothetical protein BECKLPF1236A_GA0070988_102201 [Candidatus Kentron sp. LPFa]VFK31132.1 MAG: hypothetical protein BECKLPF1236C_GA0070990_101292 [Candidatus Kentron sp. LPFa]
MTIIERRPYAKVVLHSLTRPGRNRKFPNHLIENFPANRLLSRHSRESGNPVINISLNFLIVLSKIFQITD